MVNGRHDLKSTLTDGGSFGRVTLHVQRKKKLVVQQPSSTKFTLRTVNVSTSTFKLRTKKRCKDKASLTRQSFRLVGRSIGAFQLLIASAREGRKTAKRVMSRVRVRAFTFLHKTLDA